MDAAAFNILCAAAFCFLWTASVAAPGQRGDSWALLVENAGVSAMHMTLTHRNTVIMYDRTDYGPSQLRLPSGRCRHDPKDLALTVDCYAHSIELSLDLHNNVHRGGVKSVRPLEVLSDTWCSSGAFDLYGSLISTGGYNDGATAVRRLIPCANATCDWDESSLHPMSAPRWYASNQVLPDGKSMIVVGGRNVFSYEFVPSGNAATPPIPFPFLRETDIRGVENNLYPFVHLSSDGNLFIFADRKSVLLDYRRNQVIRRFPDMPGGGGRNYPSSGSSVILPLSFSDGFQQVEVFICGGAPDGSYKLANAAKANKVRIEALKTCGRMVITQAAAAWAMEEMPTARVMGDMLILPTGEVLIINGAKRGTAGWGNAAEPNLEPLLFRPSVSAGGRRFESFAASAVPRLYHSTANLLPDGRILVGGSNPNVGYAFAGVEFKTELRLEAYSPYYLDQTLDGLRPTITGLSRVDIGYGDVFTVAFSLPEASAGVEVRVYAPPFTTHSYSMNQRQLVLAASPVRRFGPRYYTRVVAPPSGVAAPPGFYLLFLLHRSVPSSAAWVRFG